LLKPAAPRLIPNLRDRNDGIQVSTIAATKFAPTKTAIRIRTIGVFRIPATDDRAPPCAARSGSRAGSRRQTISTRPSAAPSMPNR